jgi:hypothetical protein
MKTVVNMQTGEVTTGVPFTEAEQAAIAATAAATSNVPQSVTMAQAVKVLRLHGITAAQVEAAINTIQDGVERDLALIDWARATTVRRDSDLVASVGVALGLSEAERDALFIQAATL